MLLISIWNNSWRFYAEKIIWLTFLARCSSPTTIYYWCHALISISILVEVIICRYLCTFFVCHFVYSIYAIKRKCDLMYVNCYKTLTINFYSKTINRMWNLNFKYLNPALMIQLTIVFLKNNNFWTLNSKIMPTPKHTKILSARSWNLVCVVQILLRHPFKINPFPQL